MQDYCVEEKNIGRDYSYEIIEYNLIRLQSFILKIIFIFDIFFSLESEC